MADIVFPIVTGNARIVSQQISASTNPVFWITESGTGVINSEAEESIGSAFYIAVSDTAAISGEAAGSSNPVFHIIETGSESVSGEAAATWQRWIELAGFAQITASIVYANRYTKDTMLILTLQPGESVIIDSGKYTVTKGSVNAIGAHTGEWIDTLNYETANIDIRPNASTISAEIEYSPRYL